MISILLVDDHDLVRFGIEKMLEAEPGFQVVATVRSGEEAILRARELQPAIVLMDLHMPGMGGLEATRRIANHCPHTRIIGLSVYDEDPFPAQLLKAGASGYLTKGASVSEILLAIKAVLAGEHYISAGVAGKMVARGLNPEGSPFSYLSRRELEIALMLVNCQKVADIARQLNINTKTVNSYRYRIFEKLGIDSDVELAWLALRYGVVEFPATV